MVETFGFSLLYVHALFYSLEAVNLRFVLTIHSFLFLNMGIHEPKGFKNEPKRSRLHKKPTLQIFTLNKINYSFVFI